MKIFDSKYLKLYEVEKNGESWIFSSRHDSPFLHKPNGIIIVPIVRCKNIIDNQIVVIEEFRSSINDYEISFPSGHIDYSVSLEDNIRRELLEETGLELIEIEEVSPNVYSSTGFTDECNKIVIVSCKGKIKKTEIIPYVLNYNQLAEFVNGDKKISTVCWSILFGYIKQGLIH